MRAIAIIAMLLLIGCDSLSISPWAGSAPRWYAVGERLDCPAPMYLVKAYGPHVWRDPALDVTPDGEGPPYAMVTLVTCDPAKLVGILGALPYGEQLFSEWSDGAGMDTYRARWKREYHRDASGALLDPLEWHIVAAGDTPVPYCRIIVHEIENGRAKIELSRW